ncbi:MAG: hypothetical protein NUW01_18220, partial [Gemmatimonadaceae bacterium]|nr:hypothetical protein [Gemmatimonadaceae bacterium]
FNKAVNDQKAIADAADRTQKAEQFAAGQTLSREENAQNAQQFAASQDLTRGNTLLGLGSRPETLIRYLYALRGQQAPQQLGGVAPALPGYPGTNALPSGANVGAPSSSPAVSAAVGSSTPPALAGAPVQNGVPMLAGGVQNGGVGSGMLTPQPASLLQNNAANPGYESNLAALARQYPALAQQLAAARGAPTAGAPAASAPPRPAPTQAPASVIQSMQQTGSAVGYQPAVGSLDPAGSGRIFQVFNGQQGFALPENIGPGINPFTGEGRPAPAPVAAPPPVQAPPVQAAPPPIAAPQPAPVYQPPMPTYSAPQLSGFTGTPVQATQQINAARAATPPPPSAPAIAPMSGNNNQFAPTQSTNDFFARMRALGAYGEGGIIPEKVVGVGTESGQPYEFGEKGTEAVMSNEMLQKLMAVAGKVDFHSKGSDGNSQRITMTLNGPPKLDSKKKPDMPGMNSYGAGGTIGYSGGKNDYNPAVFNPPDLSSIVGRGFNTPGIPLPPQVNMLTGGGQSLIPSAQTLTNALPSEVGAYSGFLTDEAGVQANDVFSLAKRLAPQATGVRTPRYAG